MTWQELGGLGEFVGSIAVVVSLLFVVRELRQSTKVNRAAALELANARAVALNDAPMRDLELTRIIREGGDDLSSDVAAAGTGGDGGYFSTGTTIPRMMMF